MIKGSIQEDSITIVNIYARNIGATQYIRQKGDITDIKGNITGEIDSGTITPLSHQRTDHQDRKLTRKHVS